MVAAEKVAAARLPGEGTVTDAGSGAAAAGELPPPPHGPRYAPGER